MRECRYSQPAVGLSTPSCLGPSMPHPFCAPPEHQSTIATQIVNVHLALLVEYICNRILYRRAFPDIASEFRAAVRKCIHRLKTVIFEQRQIIFAHRVVLNDGSRRKNRIELRVARLVFIMPTPISPGAGIQSAGYGIIPLSSK